MRAEGPVINRTILKRLTINDGKIAEVCTIHVRVFITLNDPPPGYKILEKFRGSFD